MSTRCLYIAMGTLTIEWDLRLLWVRLPLQMKFYLTALILSAIYCCISLLQISIRLRMLAATSTTTEAESISCLVSARLRHLQQFHFLLLLLFGLFLTDEVFRTAQSITYARLLSYTPTILELLDPLLAFSYFALAVLTVLHSLQWLTSTRVNSAARRRRRLDL
jgi:hypothetical protein